MCSAPLRPEGRSDERSRGFREAARIFLKLVFDSAGTLSYISPVPSAGGRSREASLGWDGSGACGRGHANPGLGRPRPIRGAPRIGDHPRLIRPPRTTAGPPESWERVGGRRARLTCVRAESSDRPGPDPETRPPTRTEDLGQKPPRGTPGHWHPIKIESRSLASCSPRSLTVRRLSPGNARGIWRAPTSPGGR